MIFAGLTLAAFGTSHPDYFALLHTVCAGAPCTLQQLPPTLTGSLQQFGFSVTDYTIFSGACTVVLAMVWFAVAAVIFWRASSDWMALLVALMLVSLGQISVTGTIEASHSIWQIPNELSNFLAFICLFLVCFLFPDGRFVPRGTRWIMLAFLCPALLSPAFQFGR